MSKYLLVIIYSLFLWTNVAAEPIPSKISLDTTSIFITNNTNHQIHIQSSLITTDHYFVRGKQWDENTLNLAPYETKKVLWFNRNIDVKSNQLYQFDLLANTVNSIEKNLQITFHLMGKPVFGSTLTTELIFPDQTKQNILMQNELKQFPNQFWGGNYTLYARKWLPRDKLFTNYHFVINKLENNIFDTIDRKKISILTYNTQLMPFYTGVVNHLNHPEIRAKSIPEKITGYDVVILEELFDHDLRTKMIHGMQPAYPYHTNVVGDHTTKLLTGGVMIFSKWPILREEQIIYQRSAGIDGAAAKGAVYAMINKEGKIYHIIGTHLQANNNKKDILAREYQLKELANFIDRLAIPHDQPLLLGGDFNIDAFDNHINNLLSILQVNLINNIGYRYSVDGTINSMTVKQNRLQIDYIFYNNFYAKPKIALNKIFILRDLKNEAMWPAFDLSDHFPIASYFDFSD